MVNLDDGCLVVLENTPFDIYRLIGGYIFAVGREGKTLMLLYEEVEQRQHLLLGCLDFGAGLCPVVVQM